MDDDTQKPDRKHKPRKKPQARPGVNPDAGNVTEIDDDLADTLDAIAGAETDDFFELCKIGKIDPLKDLAGTDMHSVDISGKDLSGADFTHTDLRGAKCVGTKLVNAKLVDAELQNADFCGADLTGADLTNADISGADFSGAKVTERQLAMAKGIPAARPPVNAGQMQKYRSRKNINRNNGFFRPS